MSIDILVGLQRGDEGKGRFVDLAASEYDVIARGNGGANAGHTVVPEGLEPIALHQIPSGIAYPGKLNVIGSGVYLDPRRLRDEKAEVESAGLSVDADNLVISSAAHLVLPHHIELDKARESGENGQGSTKAGIAYVASDKYLREGVRFESIRNPRELYSIALEGLMNATKMRRWEADEIARDFVAATEELKAHMADTVEVLNERLDMGERILAEGAQAYWLDINHGMYPAVTSSHTTAGGLLDALGVAPSRLGKVTGVAKVVKSHVGGGPFVTEIKDEILAEHIRGPQGAVDSEYGATTKRARRIGYPDIVELRNAVRTNGVNELILSKVDHMRRYGRTVLVAHAYSFQGETRLTAPSSAYDLEQCIPQYTSVPTSDADISDVRERIDLPGETEELIALFEEQLDVEVVKIGVGPKRDQYVR